MSKSFEGRSSSAEISKEFLRGPRRTSGLYEFGPFRLDLERRVFTRDQQVLPLPPKSSSTGRASPLERLREFDEIRLLLPRELQLSADCSGRQRQKELPRCRRGNTAHAATVLVAVWCGIDVWRFAKGVRRIHADFRRIVQERPVVTGAALDVREIRRLVAPVIRAPNITSAKETNVIEDAV